MIVASDEFGRCTLSVWEKHHKFVNPIRMITKVIIINRTKFSKIAWFQNSKQKRSAKIMRSMVTSGHFEKIECP
jgi:hypothetical protein